MRRIVFAPSFSREADDIAAYIDDLARLRSYISENDSSAAQRVALYICATRDRWSARRALSRGQVRIHPADSSCRRCKANQN